MIDFSPYQNFSINSKLNYLTVFVHDKSKEDILTDIKNRIKKLKSLSDKVKRMRIEESFYHIVKYLERSNCTTLNNIFLVSSQAMEVLEINALYCREWSLPTYYFESDDKINLAYLNDLFNNQDYHHAIHCDGTVYNHYIGTQHKKKLLSCYATVTDLAKIDKPFIAYGNIKSFTHPQLVSLVPRNLSWKEVIDIFEKSQMEKNIANLENILVKISDPRESHRFVFKAEVHQAISDFRLKELFILEKNYKDFDLENVNFNVVKVKSLKKGDGADTLDKNFSGVIGVTYF